MSHSPGAACNPSSPEKKHEGYLENIVGVIALLTLGAAPVSAQEKIKEGAENTKNAAVKGAKAATDATKDGLSKTAEVMTDTWITTVVHARFVGEDLLKDSENSVDTNKHVVTLKGTVACRTGRTKAETSRSTQKACIEWSID